MNIINCLSSKQILGYQNRYLVPFSDVIFQKLILFKFFKLYSSIKTKDIFD